MPKQDYIQRPDDAFANQLQQFKTGIPPLATTLGVSAAQVTAQAADADYFSYVTACQDIIQSLAQKWTAWKDTVRDGGATPVPTLPTAVTAVLPGIEARFRALVKLVKASPNYTEAIGEGLGIEGAVTAQPPAGSILPKIRVELVGGQVVIHWGWEGQRSFVDALEIQVDRNDGHGWTLLVIDTTPNYTDTTPLPATPAVWKYRAIFRKGDARTGQWTDPAEITVAA